MNTQHASVQNRLLFALLALAMVAVTLLAPKLGAVSADRSATAIGVLLAFTVELPLYFWLLILRRQGASPLYAVPVAVLGYLFCRWSSAAAGSEWIARGWMLLVPLEALLLTVLTRRALRVVHTSRTLPRSSDLIERLLLATEREFPANRVIAVMMYELGLMYYALGGRPGIALRSQEEAFTYHRRGGLRVIYGVAVLFGCFEMLGVHVLLARLSPAAAWALTGFEFYGVVWVIGLLRSVDRLPIVLDERGIHIRFGVIYALFVPYEAVQELQRGRLYSVDKTRKNFLNCAFINAPDCILKLRAARAVRLPYTLSRNVDEIGLMVDEPKEFLASLERRLANSRSG
ncbi:MAG TPA: hypothetical protein VI653_15860 [Steroidobacteraceae bacterium]